MERRLTMPVFRERVRISLMTFCPQKPAPITAMLTGTVKIPLLDRLSGWAREVPTNEYP